MLNVGVIGFGYSAKTFHLPMIEAVDGMHLAAIASSRPEDVAERYPALPVYPDPATLARDSAVDLVVITSPNDSHFPIAKACLESGKHVVLEKPMTTTVSEAEVLVALADEHQATLSVFHNRRWDGDFLTLKTLIENGRLGDVRFFESHFDRFRPQVRDRWREQAGPATGVWYDLGSHLLDQALCLFGMPEALTARCLPMRDGARTADYFHVMLHYPGREVILHASSLAAGATLRFQLQGTQGSFIKYGLDPQESQLISGASPLAETFGREEPSGYGVFHDGEQAQTVETLPGRYLAYYDELVQALTEGAPAPVSARDALQVMRLLMLAEQSHAEGRTLSTLDDLMA